MIPLITKPIKRFFAIGCSFTIYDWTTWPEIIAEDLNVDEYYNLGKVGAGNEYIFNKLMQADQLYDLNENDLIIICWTNACREDRYIGKWVCPGNIFTQQEYSDDFIKKYYLNPEEALLHDFAYIKASRILLTHKKVQWHFLQMLDITKFPNQWDQSTMPLKFQNLFQTEINYLKPSFYTVLWDDDYETNKYNKEIQIFKQVDGHPSPYEHLKYLQGVFAHTWKQKTIQQIKELEEVYQQAFSKLLSRDERRSMDLGHLRNHLKDNTF